MTDTREKITTSIVDTALALAIQYCACPLRAEHVLAVIPRIRDLAYNRVTLILDSETKDIAAYNTANAALQLADRATNDLRELMGEKP